MTCPTRSTAKRRRHGADDGISTWITSTTEWAAFHDGCPSTCSELMTIMSNSRRSARPPSTGPAGPTSPPHRAQSADLERDLASSVPGRDSCQRLTGLVERQYRFGLRANFARTDKSSQLLKPRPAAVGSE